MSDDLLNMRRRVSGALYHDRFSASEAEHLLAVIFQAVGADAIGSDPDADLSGSLAAEFLLRLDITGALDRFERLVEAGPLVRRLDEAIIPLAIRP